jgi:hypothetical protein
MGVYLDMNQLVDVLISDPDFELKHYKDGNGVDFFEGASKKYIPYKATAKSAFACILKFNIIVSEQKRLVALAMQKTA